MANDTINIPRQNSYESILTQQLDGDTSALTINVATVPVTTIPSGVYLEMTINPKKDFTEQEVVLVESIDSANLQMTIKTGGRAQDRYRGDSPTALSHPVGSVITLSNPYSVWLDIEAAIEGKVSISGDTMTGELNWASDSADALIRVSNMTEAVRDTIGSPANGMLIYNTTAGQLQVYDGGAWAGIDTGASVPNASETVAGIVELATNTEMGAGTSTGGTGARLIPPNDQLVKTSSGAGDENKLAVLNASGQFADGFINASGLSPGSMSYSLPAGEAVDGSSTPQAVYISDGSNSNTAGRFYKADVNDQTNMAVRFVGFVTENAATPGTNYDVQIGGVVTGFTGLTEGIDYFLSSTAGGVTATQTNPAMKIGTAVSATELLINKERPTAYSFTQTTMASVGSGSFQDLTISTGFRVKAIQAFNNEDDTDESIHSAGHYAGNNSRSHFISLDNNYSGGNGDAQVLTNLGRYYKDKSGADLINITVQNVGDNDITIRFSVSGYTSSDTVDLSMILLG